MELRHLRYSQELCNRRAIAKHRVESTLPSRLHSSVGPGIPIPASERIPGQSDRHRPAVGHRLREVDPRRITSRVPTRPDGVNQVCRTEHLIAEHNSWLRSGAASASLLHSVRKKASATIGNVNPIHDAKSQPAMAKAHPPTAEPIEPPTKKADM